MQNVFFLLLTISEVTGYNCVKGTSNKKHENFEIVFPIHCIKGTHPHRELSSLTTIIIGMMMSTLLEQ